MKFTTCIWGAGFARKLLGAEEAPRNIQKIETGSMLITLRHCSTWEGERTGGATLEIRGKGYALRHRPHFPVISRRLRQGWTEDTLGRYLSQGRKEFEALAELWKQRESLFKHIETLQLPDPLPCDGHSKTYADMTHEDIAHWRKVSKNWKEKAA